MDEETHKLHPQDQFTITGNEVGPVPWAANEEDTLTDMAPVNASPRVPRRPAGHRRRRFPWGDLIVLPLLAGGLSGGAMWLVLHNQPDNPPPASPAVTVTPQARPGPRVTVRVPGPVRVVTRTHTTTARATVTRTVPGPTKTVAVTPTETLKTG